MTSNNLINMNYQTFLSFFFYNNIKTIIRKISTWLRSSFSSFLHYFKFITIIIVFFKTLSIICITILSCPFFFKEFFKLKYEYRKNCFDKLFINLKPIIFFSLLVFWFILFVKIINCIVVLFILFPVITNIAWLIDYSSNFTF